jgi:hypothetical protein
MLELQLKQKHKVVVGRLINNEFITIKQNKIKRSLFFRDVSCLDMTAPRQFKIA